MPKNDLIQGSLSLKELLHAVRRELAESEREREKSGETALFRTEELVLEVNFVLTQTNDAKGGVEIKVLTFGGVNFGAGESYQHQQIHKVTLKLKAVPPGTTPKKQPPGYAKPDWGLYPAEGE